MISRTELERLIVLGLCELRQAEVDLESRFRSAPARAEGGWPSFVNSLASLEAKAERLEVLLGALDSDEQSSSPVAA
jgi:hypothetical protein